MATRGLGIIIVNHETPALVLDCLRSLRPQVEGHPERRVVVVDNGSTDDSRSILEEALAVEELASWASLLPLAENGGFSAGNNAGIRSLAARRYLLLNSDTLVLPGALDALEAAIDADSRLGILGAFLLSSEKEPQVSAFRFRSPFSEAIRAAATGPVTRLLRSFDVPLPPGDDTIDPEWVSFACVMIRNEVFQEIGLLDEGYFMYFEDIDFCRRARRAGWRVGRAMDAPVIHLVGRSSEVETALRNRGNLPRYFYASRSRYFARFYGGRLGLLTANLMWLAGRTVSLLRESFGEKRPHLPVGEARGIWINWLSPLGDHRG